MLDPRCRASVEIRNRYVRPSPFTRSLKSVAPVRSYLCSFVITDANPPLFSNESFPEKTNPPSLITTRPADNPPITASFSAPHFGSSAAPLNCQFSMIFSGSAVAFIARPNIKGKDLRSILANRSWRCQINLAFHQQSAQGKFPRCLKISPSSAISLQNSRPSALFRAQPTT